MPGHGSHCCQGTPATQLPTPQLSRLTLLPACLPARLPAEEGHAVAKEQYCEPIEWYSGQHAACFAKVQHHYRGDALSLRFGEVSTATL